MSEPGFREINLSGKHVVFLFMAGAVAFVVVFLLGVSVGKGITKPDTAAAQVSPTPSPTGSDAPAAGSESTKPNPGELQYYRTLQEKGSPTPSATPAATPSATPEPPAPSPTPKATPSPSPTPAAKPATANTRFVLVDSFSNAKNANNRLAELKKKGYEAVVVNLGGRAPYKVRLGPYDSPAAAEAMAARLRKEGYKPSVIR